MNFKAVAFDLDGTLLNEKGEILKENQQALKNLQEKGVKILFVTGRHHTLVRPYVHQLGLTTPVVCCNGTYIYDFNEDKVVQGNPIDNSDALNLLSKARAENIFTAVYFENEMTFEKLNPHFTKLLEWVESCAEAIRPRVVQIPSFEERIKQGDTVWKFVISDPDLDKLDNFGKSLDNNIFSVEASWFDRLDISKQGNTKGSTLLQLLEKLRIDAKETVAFGDNFNDISMLKAVGLGIAMGQAEKEVKNSAKKVTGEHNSPCIAYELQQIFNF